LTVTRKPSHALTGPVLRTNTPLHSGETGFDDADSDSEGVTNSVLERSLHLTSDGPSNFTNIGGKSAALSLVLVVAKSSRSADC